MKSIFLTISLLFGTMFSLSIYAGPATNEFGVCLTDSLTGKERKNLAKWIYFAIAAHPEITQYSKITESSRDDTNQYVGKLVTRLMTDDCPKQASAAIKEGGSKAIEHAFGLVGQVAMQELMADKNVSGSISGFEKYLDQEKIAELSK